MANSGDRSASRRGRGHQNESEVTGVGRAAPAALAFLVGVLMQLTQEPGSQVRQPRVSPPLPSEEVSGAPLDAAGSASPSHLPAPSQHRLAGEALGEEEGTSEACDKLVDRTAKRRTQHGGVENTSQGSDASVARTAKRTAGTRGEEALPPDSWQADFLSLLSSFGSAGAGVEQTKNPLTPKREQFAQPGQRRTAVQQSKSAPSGSSQTLTPLFSREKEVRRVSSEPGSSTDSSLEGLTDKLEPRTSMLPTRVSRSSLNMLQRDGASRVGTRSRPRWAADAHEEDDTSDASDTSGENTRGAEVPVREHSHRLQFELLNLLHKLHDASLDSQVPACEYQHQSTTATPTTRRKDQQQPAKRAFPRSASAPSPGLQSCSHFSFGSNAHQQQAPEPSPPRCPLSDESLNSYLEEAYEKWRRHHLARVSSGESKQVRPRVVQRTPGRPSQDGRPTGSQHHPHRRSWPGRASEKRPPYLWSASHMSQRCGDVQCNHSKTHSSPSGKGYSRFSALDDVPSDDTSESSGENWHADASPAKTGGHPVFPASNSAPSPYRSLPAFADGNWTEHGRQAASHYQRVEQPVQEVWNQPAGPGTTAVTGRRASVPRTPLCRHFDSFQDTGAYTRTHDMFSSSAAHFWAEPRGMDGIPRGNTINAPHISGPMPVQLTGLPPWNMMVQFYNQPSPLHPERHADLPLRPPLSGHARGTPKQNGKKRFSSTREDRTTTPKATETWQGPPEGGKTTTPYAYPQKTPQLPPEEGRPAPRIEGPSTLQTAPSDLTDEPEKRGVPSVVSLSVMEVGPRAPPHSQGIPSASSTTATSPSSAAASAGTRISRQPSLRGSRIPVLRRRHSTLETQASASLSLSLPHTLRSEIGDASAAAASPRKNASQVPSPGYSHVQTLDLRAPFAAAAANPPSQPDMSGERYYTGQSSQGLFLSSPSGPQHRRAAPSTSNRERSLSSPGRTGQTASTARPGTPEENSYESASEEPRRMSHSTGAIRTKTGRAANERRAEPPVEDEFLD